MSAGGLVVGHELPKLIARVQFPAGALRRLRRLVVFRVRLESKTMDAKAYEVGSRVHTVAVMRFLEVSGLQNKRDTKTASRQYDGGRQ